MKAESSFEEERVRHWIQKHPPQRPSPMVSHNEQLIQNSMNFDTRTVHQTPNRPGTVTNSTPYKLTGQKEATSNGYLGGAPNLGNFTTTQPMGGRNGLSGVEHVSMRAPNTHSDLAAVHSSAQRDLSKTEMERAGQNEFLDDVSIVTKSVTDDIMAMFGDPTLQNESRPREYVTLPSAHQDVFKTGRSYVNESKAGVGRPAAFVGRAPQSELLDDATMNTKSVTDDIMAMFSAPSAPRNLSYTNGSIMGTELNGNSVERVVQSKVLDDVTIDTKSVTDDIMAMFSGSPAHNHPRARVQTSTPTQNHVSYIRSLEGITPSQNGGLRATVALSQTIGIIRNSQSPSDSESRALNATADYKLTTSTIQQQPRQVAAEGMETEVSAHISWDPGSQVHRNGVTTLQTREVIASVRKDGTSSSSSAVDNVATPNQKHMESATVGQWGIKKETRSSILVESSKAEVGVIQDLSTSNGKRRLVKEDSSYDDGNVRSTPGRKRSSWSTSAKDTQCIYISDEDEKVDSREKKKQRGQFTSTISNEGSVVKESGTPVLERSLAMREKQKPSQYSPAIGSAPIKNMASADEETFVPR